MISSNKPKPETLDPVNLFPSNLITNSDTAENNKNSEGLNPHASPFTPHPLQTGTVVTNSHTAEYGAYLFIFVLSLIIILLKGEQGGRCVLGIKIYALAPKAHIAPSAAVII